jgi:hypothetical protein
MSLLQTSFKEKYQLKEKLDDSTKHVTPCHSVFNQLMIIIMRMNAILLSAQRLD